MELQQKLFNVNRNKFDEDKFHWRLGDLLKFTQINKKGFFVFFERN
jgi:hypothetical protein